jgi:hypothetical protein
MSEVIATGAQNPIDKAILNLKKPLLILDYLFGKCTRECKRFRKCNLVHLDDLSQIDETCKQKTTYSGYYRS